MKNLKGSATWKNVDTISFGGELLVQYTRAEQLHQQPGPKRNGVHLFFQVSEPSHFLIEGVSLA